MNIEFSVRLPTDAQSVPLMRGLLRQALEHLTGPCLRAAVVHHDAVATLRERSRRRRTHSPGGSGHQHATS